MLVRRLLAFIAPGGARSGAALYRRTRLWVVLAALAANTGGAIVVFVFAAWVVPQPHHLEKESAKIIVTNLAATGAYLLVSLVVGVTWGLRRLHGIGEWLRRERDPTAEERRVVVLAPARIAQVVAVMWGGATLVFGVLNATLFSLALGVIVGIVVFLGGTTTTAVAYLLSERLLRTVTGRALSGAPPDRPLVPGVVARSLLAWTLGTGVPLFGLLTVAVVALARGDVPAWQLSVTILGLGGCAILVGLLIALLAARATADPLVALRGALGKVEQGDYDVEVTVNDGSELGLVQAGFNRMANELRERQRVREIFGAYVDQSVAEHILEEGVSLEGEEIDVTALFLDVRGFTSLAESTPAKDVVGRLNRLFEAVVPIVNHHEGHVDKFVGDGLLAVFGAPQRQEAHADAALAAACEIAQAVAEDDELDLEVGIGLSSGEVIAGNVGGAGRLEFSVIGDAVNTAARVEAATRETGDVILLTEDTAERLRHEAVELEGREDVELRGKSEPVKLYAPKLPVEAGG
jgi:adenylate cyclase